MLVSGPLAAVRFSVGVRLRLSFEEAGKTQTSAPVSTKKDVPVARFYTDKVLVLIKPTAAVIGGRLARFPAR